MTEKISVTTIRESNKTGRIIFWLLAVVILCSWLGGRALWGPEDRWAEAVREMQLTGDYFNPQINGQTYFDKPLVSYWLIALVSAITGKLNEWAVRLPSALAGLLALGCTISLGKRILSERAGRTAGWILLSCYGFLFWARTGEADMEHLAAIIAALAWYWAKRDKPGFINYLVFYVICFTGAQTKGLAAIAIPVMLVFVDLVNGGRWRKHITITHISALILAMGVYFAPFAGAKIFNPPQPGNIHCNGLYLVFRENIIRYFKPFDHKEPFYVYFYNLPALFLPWTALLVGALVRAGVFWKQQAAGVTEVTGGDLIGDTTGGMVGADKIAAGSVKITANNNHETNDGDKSWGLKWLYLSVVLIFLFYTVSGSRRSYYILPIIPFCALLSAVYLERETDVNALNLILNIQNGFIAAMVIAELLSPAVWPIIQKQNGFIISQPLFWSVLVVGILGVGWWLLERCKPGISVAVTGANKKLATSLVVATIVLGSFFAFQHEMFDKYRSTKPFCLALKGKLAGLSKYDIAIYRKFPIKLFFYLELPHTIPILKTPEDLEQFLSKGGNRVLVVHNKYKDAVIQVLRKFKQKHPKQDIVLTPSLSEKRFPWEKPKKYDVWIIPAK